MLANTPAMLEAHYGVPMAGAVLNTLNTRLDAAIIAFTLDHAEAKVLITDREFSKVMKDALARVQGQAAGHRLRRPGIHRPRRAARQHSNTRSFLREGDPDFAWQMPRRRMGRDFAQLYLRHHRRSQGRRLSPPRRLSARARQCHHLRHGQASGLSVDAADVPLQRLVLSLDAVRSSPAPMSACARCARRRSSTPSRRTRSRICAARRS